MARLSVGQKAQRVLKFLTALTNPLIVVRLAGFGLDQSQVDKGWTLLRGASSASLDLSPAAVQANAKAIVELDTWENFWFPIIQTILRVRFPAAEAWVFRNLTQQEGQNVVLSVGTLLERLDALCRNDDLPAEVSVDAAAALALLGERGLTTAVLDDARRLLVEIGQIKSITLSDPEAQKAARQEAEKQMWAWYLEWSAIAQRVITNRRHLRSLGYRLSPSGVPGSVVVDDFSDDSEDEPVEDDAELTDEVGVA